jgi:hypothetical protein
VIRGPSRGHNDTPFGQPTPKGLSAAWGLATLRVYLVLSVTINSEVEALEFLVLPLPLPP